MDWNQILSSKVTEMEESATLKMAKLARELKEQGKKIISLSLGEPDFDTPDNIKQSAINAILQGHTKYAPVSGVPELKKAIQAKMARDNNIQCDLNQIVISTGAKQSIANVCLSLLNPGDETILLAPYWVSYKAIAEFVGSKVVEVKAGIDQEYKVTAEALEKAINSNTKLIIFSSPCNPSGSVFSRDELESIAKVLEKHPQVFILSDEIYEYIVFSEKHFSLGSLESIKDRVITVNGMSKGFSMTGWRLGYMIAHPEIAKACEKIQGQFTSGATTFNQHAAAYALTNAKEDALKMTKSFERRKEIFSEALNKIPGFRCNDPKGAFYLFPDISAFFGKKIGGSLIKTAEDFSLLLLKHAQVATVSGEAFGNSECLRLSYAASEEDLLEATRRISNFVDSLED
jgi:aspartate aminotransferase